MSKAAGAGLSTVNEVTQVYYDSTDADTFYRLLWGGEDIHIGLYDTPDDDVFTASRRTVERLSTHLDGHLGPGQSVLDIGSGYGGLARALARRFGCHATGLNISEVQNAYGRERTAEVGLSGKVDIAWGNFEDMPFDGESFDVVVSMDAMLHSGNRERVVAEAARVLKPGGRFVFTDILQDENASADELAPVLKRIHLDTMGTWSFYEDAAGRHGLSSWLREDQSDHLPVHYARVLRELERRWDDLKGPVSETYMENARTGLTHWITAGREGRLAWGLQGYVKDA